MQKYNKVKGQWDRLKNIKAQLYTKDTNGCYPKRVEYDKKGGKLREKIKK